MKRLFQKKPKASTEAVAAVAEQKPLIELHPDSTEEAVIYGPNEAWEAIDKIIQEGGPNVPKTTDLIADDHSKSNRGWKTIRVFVSSTFRDFFHEREVLVKKIFPQLREWCNERKLHLVECDLRWGVPAGTSTKETLELCLEEIQRCYIENTFPFFINLTCRRVGLIPEPQSSAHEDGIPVSLIKKYSLVFGLSITEMEIVYGAYQSHNPNAFFLQRHQSFLDAFQKGVDRSAFDYDIPQAKEKVQIMKDHLNKKFSDYQSPRFLEYPAEYNGIYEQENRVLLKIPEDIKFEEKILDFLMERIQELYPHTNSDENEIDKFEEQRLAHEAFFESKKTKGDSSELSDIINLGRVTNLEKIKEYVKGLRRPNEPHVPLMVTGKPGIGKTHFMAKIIIETSKMLSELPSDRGQSWHMFYHFVGAVPQSTDVLIMLQRLLKQIFNLKEKDVPSDKETVTQMIYSALTNPNILNPIVIVIDALNQLEEDDEKIFLNMKWLPSKLSDNVRCVVSVVTDSKHHQLLMKREPKLKSQDLINIDPLNAKKIITALLKRYTKELSDPQMETILKKQHSKNPLWLTLACEELRVHGNFRTLNKKVQDLGDGLSEILNQVFKRFGDSSGASKSLIHATLCCIECSKRGLLETELIDILAAEEKLRPENMGKKGTKLLEQFYRSTGTRLSSFKWSQVRHLIKPFIRPYGDLSEGRLDFYHRSISEAVRVSYLKSAVQKEHKKECHWWHTVLAFYFECGELVNHPKRIERKVEEYPYHLAQLGEKARLEKFILNWEVVDILYNEDHSYTLLWYWKVCGGPDKIYEGYKKQIESDENNSPVKVKHAERCVQVGRLLLQAGSTDKALELGERGINILKDLPEQEKLDLYRLLCDVYTEKYKLEHFKVTQGDVKNYDREDRLLSQIKGALIYSQRVINIIGDDVERDEENKKWQFMYGKQLIRHSFIYELVMENGGITELPKEVARQQGLCFAAKALQIFTKKIPHKGYQAEATMNIGHLHRGFNYEIQLRKLLESKEICKEAYGESHMLMGRIWKNIGIAHEENERRKQCPGPEKNYKPPYDAFIQVHKLYHNLFGPDHPKTKAALYDIESEPYKTLFNDGKYKFQY